MDNSDLLSKMIAQSGMRLLNATAATSTFPSWGLIVREDTYITTWVDDKNNDLVALFGIDGRKLVSTDPVLTVPNNRRTKELVVATGSVWQIP